MTTDANDIARNHGKGGLRVVIDNDADSLPPKNTQDAWADQFAERHADHFRYVAKWRQWWIFDGIRWHEDSTGEVKEYVRRFMRSVAKASGKKAPKYANQKTISDVEILARGDRRMAAIADQWDCAPWDLNTPAGVIDLRTGAMRKHRCDDYMTRVTGVSPDANCSIDLWRRFLDRTFNGNPDTIAFVQRVAGHALTGDTREHALFFGFGKGANGKSVFINALTGCLGSYHRTSPIETFTASGGDRHPTDLAGLHAARLVTAVETEEGRRWAESKIKSLTGGDKISARFMRQDFFEFTPVFKLIIVGNHRPGLRSVDDAIRRRFHLIPFTVTIPEPERDGQLGEKLKAEWPAILQWMIDGCLAWQRDGLCPPEAVRSATAAYLEAEDALAAWIEDAAEPDADAFELTTALYRSWKAWADRAGEHPGTLRKFSQRLEDRGEAFGVSKGRNGSGQRGFTGLSVSKPSDLAGHSSAGDAGGEAGGH
jgi:putative DNA primase/helicase